MRLTAWELAQEGIDHAIIADNAAGYYMQQGKIDLVLTGADRIAANGDIANKIGTYSKAVLAKETIFLFILLHHFPHLTGNCTQGKIFQSRNVLLMKSSNSMKWSLAQG